MTHEAVEYQADGINMLGYISYSDEVSGKRPAVLVVHAWRGQDDFARRKADDLAGLGYIGFAVDMYGERKHAATTEEALQLMLPLFLDRTLLRKRINAAVDVLRNHPLVDAREIGAIGFCFGGMTVIELLRGGAPVKGVVSFHGLLGWHFANFTAPKVANAQKISGKLLILHGYKDPFVTPEEIVAVQKEFNDAGVDWEMDIYGQAVHAFANPEATDEKGGVLYHPVIAERAGSAMLRFFKELFSR